jgi:hypothetical protein
LPLFQGIELFEEDAVFSSAQKVKGKNNSGF